MSIDTSILASVALIIISIFAGFLAALWIALTIWTFRDIRDRTRDSVVHLLACVLVAFLFFPGWVIYLIIRPRKTLEEDYQLLLEEESLLQVVEQQQKCPGCEREIESDWSICPSCHTQIRKSCRQCGRLLDLRWNICPYCCTPVTGMRVETENRNQKEGNTTT